MAYQRRVQHARLLIEKLLVKKQKMGGLTNMLSTTQLEIQRNEIKIFNKVKERKDTLIAEIERLYA